MSPSEAETQALLALLALDPEHYQLFNGKVIKLVERDGICDQCVFRHVSLPVRCPRNSRTGLLCLRGENSVWVWADE